MRRLPPLNSLRTFNIVSKVQNLSRAAEELNITQGAVSQQIRLLEEWLEKQLFIRLPRGVELTSEGKNLVYSVQKAFEILEDGIEEIREEGEKKILSITTVASFAAKFLVPRLERFQEIFPKIDVRISTSQHLTDIVKEGFDLGIRFGRGKWKGFETEALPGNNKIVVCSPELKGVKNGTFEFNEFSNQRVLFGDSFNDWKTWSSLAGVQNFAPKEKIIFDDMNVGIQAAIEGQGMLLVHKILVAGDLEAGRLIEPINFEIPSETGFFFIFPENRKINKDIRAFCEWLKNEVGDKN